MPVTVFGSILGTVQDESYKSSGDAYTLQDTQIS